LVLISFVLFAKPVRELLQLANHDETASHILLIPFITAWLLTQGENNAAGSAFSLYRGVLPGARRF